MTIYRYESTDAGAPTLSGTAGSLIAVLDACLVDGYGVGAGEKEPAGWAKPFASANKGIYRAPSGLRRYYRVNDAGTVSGNGATRAHIRGSESATGIDAQAESFPSVALPAIDGMVIAKSNVASGDARRWTVLADAAGCYLFVEANPDYPGLNCGTYFGDFVSYADSDPHAACIVGDITDWGPTQDPRTAGNSRFSALSMLVADVAQAAICNGVINRSHTGVSGQQRAALAGPFLLPTGTGVLSGASYQAGAMGYLTVGMPAYPTGITGLVLDVPRLVHGSLLRGYLPGVYYPLTSKPFPNRTELSGLRALPGRTALALDLPAAAHNNSPTNGSFTQAAGTGQCILDLTGPWR